MILWSICRSVEKTKQNIEYDPIDDIPGSNDETTPKPDGYNEIIPKPGGYGKRTPKPSGDYKTTQKPGGYDKMTEKPGGYSKRLKNLVAILREYFRWLTQ